MTQSDIFQAFMKAAWGDGEDIPPGTFADAFEVATTLGAKPNGPKKKNNGREWLFPDGSVVYIIERDGHGTGIAASGREIVTL
jgi:hypothetical protein